MLNLVERLVARGGPSALAARLRRRSRLVLAYHNVVADGDAGAGERSLHLPFARFCEQLDALQRSHEVVSLGALLQSRSKPRRPLAAITFDDAYRGCLTLALPELARRSMPATVFVAPGLLGSAGCWWDLLASPDTGTLPRSDREHILTALEGDGAAALRWSGARGGTPRSLPWSHGISTEAELQACARIAGIGFGAHTWSHRNLARLRPSELAAELDRPLEWLRTRLSNVIPWLAFPYGLHTAAVTAAAHRRGYEGVLRISGGWVAEEDIRARDLPRLNIPASMSTDRFMLKTRGIIPL